MISPKHVYWYESGEKNPQKKLSELNVTMVKRIKYRGKLRYSEPRLLLLKTNRTEFVSPNGKIESTPKLYTIFARKLCITITTKEKSVGLSTKTDLIRTWGFSTNGKRAQNFE